MATVGGNSPAARDEACVRCGTSRIDDDPFCENCGHEFGTEAAPPTWQVVIKADRAHYDRLSPPGVAFPKETVDRVVALTEAEMLIGRRSRSRGTSPQIDCSGPPEDPAISHRHAMLVRDDAGNYGVCDLGSTNGTTINDDPRPIPMNMHVPLRHGDEVHVGAFTTLALRDAARESSRRTV
jgi:pSer/pThr/pTyr-binding forkhead associated (FHA) protein